MEHRQDNRLSTSVPVSIRNKKLLLGRFTTQDISRGGMSIFDSGKCMSAGDFVHLEFGDIRRKPDLGLWYMTAIVIYRKNNFVGLMWAEESLLFQSMYRVIASKVTQKFPPVNISA